MDNPIVVIRRKAFETNLVVALTLATSHLLQPRRPAPPKATRRGIAPRVAALAVSELSRGAFFGKVLNCLVAYHDVVKFPLPTANTAQAQSPISIKKPHALLASSLFPLLVAGLAAGSGSFCTHTHTRRTHTDTDVDWVHGCDLKAAAKWKSILRLIHCGPVAMKLAATLTHGAGDKPLSRWSVSGTGCPHTQCVCVCVYFDTP